ncbi:MAG: DUF427 domain-containing protein [bacterium]|nr:DUF427 domain-containing protein [bacterium]
MPSGESLYHKYPDYKLEFEVPSQRVQVRVAGRVIAESSRALRVLETRHEPVLYFPREDVRMELLERTDHETFCPFKGDACYYSLRLADQSEENLVWTYEDPFDQAADLKDYLSFYADRVEFLLDS